jgi:hypothetical protein
VKKKKNENTKLRFLGGKKRRKNEYNRSSTIEDLPLLSVHKTQPPIGPFPLMRGRAGIFKR